MRLNGRVHPGFKARVTSSGFELMVNLTHFGCFYLLALTYIMQKKIADVLWGLNYVFFNFKCTV